MDNLERLEVVQLDGFTLLTPGDNRHRSPMGPG